jgi:hypothetical protein
MSELGAVYRAKLFGRIFAQVTENVFYYYIDADPSSDVQASQFKDAMVTNFGTLLSAVTSTQWTSEHVQVDNLSDPQDFSDTATSEFGGDIAGDCLPSFVAWGFEYGKPAQGYRNGSKRFAGVPEAAQVNGVIDPSVVAAINALAAGLFAPLELTTLGRAVPAILYRATNIAPFPNGQPAKFVIYKDITSQRSRLVGKGV